MHQQRGARLLGCTLQSIYNLFHVFTMNARVWMQRHDWFAYISYDRVAGVNSGVTGEIRVLVGPMTDTWLLYEKQV